MYVKVYRQACIVSPIIGNKGGMLMYTKKNSRYVLFLTIIVGKKGMLKYTKKNSRYALFIQYRKQWCFRLQSCYFFTSSRERYAKVAVEQPNWFELFVYRQGESWAPRRAGQCWSAGVQAEIFWKSIFAQYSKNAKLLATWWRYLFIFFLVCLIQLQHGWQVCRSFLYLLIFCFW